MISDDLKFCLKLDYAHTHMVRRLEDELAAYHGLSFRNFVVLLHLCSAEGDRLQRDELARRLALTQTELARIVIPMEKLGLISREAVPDNSEARYVKALSGGKYLFSRAVGWVDRIAQELGEIDQDILRFILKYD
ncbi:MarR family transcriptional regulator [Pseudoduganella sp. RAF19]|uniref:MarR family transcriptional regulator n=1 Tax=Pseudoduganella sp. RAF19 TaxID=3233052 RepID=UPI003F9BD2F5